MQKNSLKKTLIDSLIIGAALFSMFFGAGNMIFPPYLGMELGTEWVTGFLGYYIADIGLALVAIIAQIRTKGFEGILTPLGKIVGTIIMFSIIMCIGPLICIPRTGATVYELSIMPLMSGFNMYVFYIIFFLVVFLLCVKESAVVDIVGKIITPLLFFGLIFLVIKGIITPLGGIDTLPKGEHIVALGIEAGYQSMDVLGAAVFGILVLNSAVDKGHKNIKDQSMVASGASIVAGVGLLVVYLGLTYLGATVSGIYNTHIARTDLLVNIIQRLIAGNYGLIFFAIITALACLSTAIALASSSAKYLEELFNKPKLNYKVLVGIICLFSAIASCVGVEKLVVLASPILSTLYPPVLALILMSFFNKWLNNYSYRFAIGAATMMGLIETLSQFGIRLTFLRELPLSSFGLAWVVPTVVFAVIGFFVGKMFEDEK